jgi:hypothetical protein
LSLRLVVWIRRTGPMARRWGRTSATHRVGNRAGKAGTRSRSRARTARVGLGRIVALYHRSSTLYHYYIRYLFIYFSETTRRPNPREGPAYDVQRPRLRRRRDLHAARRLVHLRPADPAGKVLRRRRARRARAGTSIHTGLSLASHALCLEVWNRADRAESTMSTVGV